MSYTVFDQARIELVNRLPIQSRNGRFVYAPTSANISLTRRCLSNCRHCAPATTPTATEHLRRKQVLRFLDGLTELPISTLHIEGGEPFMAKRLLFETLQKAAENPRLLRIILETNLFWATTTERTYAILSRLAQLGLQRREFILAGNLDVFHSAISGSDRPRQGIKNARIFGLARRKKEAGSRSP